MAVRFSLGGRAWLIIAIPLAAALIMLAVSQAGEVGADSGMTDVETRLSATLSQIEGAGSNDAVFAGRGSRGGIFRAGGEN